MSTRTVFRFSIIVYFLLVIAGVVSGFYLSNPAVSDVNDYIWAAHLAARLSEPQSPIPLYFMTGAILAALIGMWFFWRPARWLFLASIAFAYVLAWSSGDPQFLKTQLQSSLFAAENTLVGVLLALSFFNRDLFVGAGAVRPGRESTANL